MEWATGGPGHGGSREGKRERHTERQWDVQIQREREHKRAKHKVWNGKRERLWEEEERDSLQKLDNKPQKYHVGEWGIETFSVFFLKQITTNSSVFSTGGRQSTKHQWLNLYFLNDAEHYQSNCCNIWISNKNSKFSLFNFFLPQVVPRFKHTCSRHARWHITHTPMVILPRAGHLHGTDSTYKYKWITPAQILVRNTQWNPYPHTRSRGQDKPTAERLLLALLEH